MGLTVRRCPRSLVVAHERAAYVDFLVAGKEDFPLTRVPEEAQVGSLNETAWTVDMGSLQGAGGGLSPREAR